jgi:hypothetical protein
LFREITFILRRSYKGDSTAIEIIRPGQSHIFVNFPDGNCDKMLSQFQKIVPKSLSIVVQNQPPLEFFRTLSFTSDWLNYKLTNFQYLIWLNLT